MAGSYGLARERPLWVPQATPIILRKELSGGQVDESNS